MLIKLAKYNHFLRKFSNQKLVCFLNWFGNPFLINYKRNPIARRQTSYSLIKLVDESTRVKAEKKIPIIYSILIAHPIALHEFQAALAIIAFRLLGFSAYWYDIVLFSQIFEPIIEAAYEKIDYLINLLYYG